MNLCASCCSSPKKQPLTAPMASLTQRGLTEDWWLVELVVTTKSVSINDLETDKMLLQSVEPCPFSAEMNSFSAEMNSGSEYRSCKEEFR